MSDRSATLAITPKTRQPAGQKCDCPPARPEVSTARAGRIAALARALSDPVRVQLVDVLRAHPGRLCPCELVPLFHISQPTLSHHLKVLRNAGILDSEKHGLFVYYYVRPGALEDIAGFLTPAAADRSSR